MEKSNISFLNTIVKTIISISLVVLFWWFVGTKTGLVALTIMSESWIYRVMSVSFNFLCVYILWKILPSDTRLWVRNWKKEDFVKTGTFLSLISTVIKIPFALFAVLFFLINLAVLHFFYVFNNSVVICVMILIVLWGIWFMLPDDIKYWLKQWNK